MKPNYIQAFCRCGSGGQLWNWGVNSDAEECQKKTEKVWSFAKPTSDPPVWSFLREQNWPIISFWKLNHWCVKQILRLVPSKNLYICFCYLSLHLSKIGQNLISARHWDQYIRYITLKAFAMASGDGTKCFVFFGYSEMATRQQGPLQPRCSGWESRYKWCLCTSRGQLRKAPHRGRLFSSWSESNVFLKNFSLLLLWSFCIWGS